MAAAKKKKTLTVEIAWATVYRHSRQMTTNARNDAMCSERGSKAASKALARVSAWERVGEALVAALREEGEEV